MLAKKVWNGRLTNESVFLFLDKGSVDKLIYLLYYLSPQIARAIKTLKIDHIYQKTKRIIYFLQQGTGLSADSC